jgi:hypothetical protein
MSRSLTHRAAGRKVRAMICPSTAAAAPAGAEPARAGQLAEDVYSAEFPARGAWEATYVATAPQVLPPMPASALRGALLRSLKSLVCTEPARSTCGGCREAGRCAYPELVSGEDAAAIHPGFDAPPLLVLGSDKAYSGAPHRLAAGDSWRFRVVLVGKALRSASLVGAALRGVARRGLGHRPGFRDGRRPDLELAGIRPVELAAAYACDRWSVRFASPARLHRDGKAASSLDPGLLWSAMVRRARTLVAADGRELSPLAREAPFTFCGASAKPVRVSRWSARQGKHMEWDALVGEAELRVEAHHVLVGHLLAFAQDVQLGKGTQFGFGALQCTPLGDP